MSLLNEALKRASQSQPEFDTVRIHLPPPAPTPKAPTGRGLALPVIVILLMVTAVVFIAHSFLGRKHAPHIATAAAVPPPVQAVPAAPKLAAQIPAAPRPAAPKPAMPRPAMQPATQPVTQPATEQTDTDTAPAPMPLPAMKLQGITYYNAKWQAIINGKTVYVGDTVDGFRVAVISRNYVSFIAPDGSKSMLPLGD